MTKEQNIFGNLPESVETVDFVLSAESDASENILKVLNTKYPGTPTVLKQSVEFLEEAEAELNIEIDVMTREFKKQYAWHFASVERFIKEN